ncbi:GGDEF domain-containing protein [Arthrobacter sp. MP_M7]|nr:GGDEF domain-containing protein [Arthrobacter sp. MP_M4]MEC5204882.1 GGDEF domain-containing protein [Arthrobacter sp. MP_M7]
MAGLARGCLAETVTVAGTELQLGMSVGRADTAVPADAGEAGHQELAKALLIAADQDMYRVKSERRRAALRRPAEPRGPASELTNRNRTTTAGDSRRRRAVTWAAGPKG